MKNRDAQRVERTKKRIKWKLGRTHEGNIAHYNLHNRSREEAVEEKGRYKSQQFKTKEAERTQDEGGIVYIRNRDPIKFAEYV